MKELLSPAGNMECLKAAVNNGADAIYLGGKTFGARAYAGNFSNDELKEAVNYAHLYGVKIYITVNTIIYNTEVDELIKYIEYLYKIGVDALIMQDIGMISLVRKVFPNMEVHASTQCHNHNNEGIKLLKELGVTRIVLDREMSLEEIENIDVDIEKEVFIHGALCNCYSGCCLFSFMNGGRSGNRDRNAGSIILASNNYFITAIEEYKVDDLRYDFNGVIISRFKVLRIYETLINNRMAGTYNAILYAICKNSILTEEQYRNITACLDRTFGNLKGVARG